jgi:hypothetical protein
MPIRPRRIAGSLKLFAFRALAEFSRAVASDPAFPPQALELLREASGGDADAIARAVSPQSAETRAALAHFLAERGAANAAAALLRQAGNDADEELRVITTNPMRRTSERLTTYGQAGAGTARTQGTAGTDPSPTPALTVRLTRRNPDSGGASQPASEIS